MNFALIILTIIILIIAIIIFSFILINKNNKKRVTQKDDEDNDKKNLDVNDIYPSFSDQIHNPINLDRSLLEIEEVDKNNLTKKENEEQHEDNFQNPLIKNSEFIF